MTLFWSILEKVSSQAPTGQIERRKNTYDSRNTRFEARRCLFGVSLMWGVTEGCRISKNLRNFSKGHFQSKMKMSRSFWTEDKDETCEQITFTKAGTRNRMETSFLICHAPNGLNISGQVLQYHKILKNSQTIGARRVLLSDQRSNLESAYRMVILFLLGGATQRPFPLPVCFCKSCKRS